MKNLIKCENYVIPSPFETDDQKPYENKAIAMKTNTSVIYIISSGPPCAAKNNMTNININIPPPILPIAIVLNK
jgi:hypothetical protein